MDKIVTHACLVGQTLTWRGLALLHVWATRLHTPRVSVGQTLKKKRSLVVYTAPGMQTHFRLAFDWHSDMCLSDELPLRFVSFRKL